MIYLTSIAFTILFVYYSKWQFSEVRGESAGKWHPYGMLMRMLFFVGVFACHFFPMSWSDYLLAGAINIFLWEILINKIALGMDLFYVGHTSKMDIALQKKKWFIYGGFCVISLIIKIWTFL